MAASAKFESFWNDLDDQLHECFTQAFPESNLQDLLDGEMDTSSPRQKYALLAKLTQEHIKSVTPTERSSKQATQHLLAMLQDQMGDYAAAEASWRQLEATSDPWRPNLAASYSLAHNLQRQKRHAEAESILRPLTLAIKLQVGEGSQQVIGCVRNLADNVKAQGRADEARGILEVARKLALNLKDEGDKQEHTVAIDEVTRRIETTAGKA